MKNEDRQFFDLSNLLVHGDLNIYHLVQSEPSITVGEYFDMLSRFIAAAPDVLSSLEKIADISNDERMRDWRTIEDMISLLKELKSDKCLPDLYSLSNAIGKGDARLAAFHAKKLINDFNDLYIRTRSAKKADRADALPNGAPTEQEPLESLLRFWYEEEENRKLMILAVDDSPDILTAISVILSEEYKVFKLPKPTMLKEILTQITPDLFLIDYKMPELNGFELIPIIRGFEEHTDTPVIYITSEGSFDRVSAAVALGACDFIVKPFQADVLRERVKKHIVRKKRFKNLSNI